MKKLVTLFLFLFIASFSFAQQETLAVDTSFGEDGIYTEENLLYGAFIMIEDKIYLGGVGGPLESPFFRLIRLNLDGTPDMTFNNSNYFIDYEQFNLTDDSFRIMVPQPDEKVLVMTERYLFRINPDGSIDNSFGEQGVIEAHPNQNITFGFNNEKIYRIYRTPNNGGYPHYKMIERRNITGEIELDFGLNGSLNLGLDTACYTPKTAEFFLNGDILSLCTNVLTKISESGNYTHFFGGNYDDAKILNEKVLAIYQSGESQSSRLVRFNSDLSLDTTLGHITFPNSIDLYFIDIYNNKIYLLGYSDDGFVMLRRLEGGDPDNSFSGNGTYTFQNTLTNPNEFRIYSFKILNDDIYIFGKNELANNLHLYKYNLVEELSTSEQSANNLNIYPNPATDKLYFENLKKNSTVKIINAEDKFIMEKTIAPNGFIDISALQKGVYVAIVDDNSFKFIKN